MPWQPGEVVEYRDVKEGRPWWRTPARVIEDTAGRVVLWWPPGTRYQRIAFDDRRQSLTLRASGSWQLEDADWWGGDSLLVIPTGAPFAIWPYRTVEGELVRWYCNLQAPLTRTASGFDTDDWTLDVVAAPDLSGWTWKDEDELAEGQRVGLYSEDDVATIRAAGAEVVSLIERRAPIFSEWSTWRAEPDWPRPTLAQPPKRR